MGGGHAVRILKNTLYITSPDIYLSLDGENIVALREGSEARRVPLHNLQGVVAFGYTGASPALMGACAKRGIAISFLTANGRFLARVTGEEHGNVTLRKEQYRRSDDERESALIARFFVAAKLYNARWVVERALRDHAPRLDQARFKTVSVNLAAAAREAAAARWKRCVGLRA